MLYASCPTCNYSLSQHIIEYEEKKYIICTDPKNSESDKETQLTELINSLNLPRYCCKMRMMSYKDIVYDIIPIKKENK